ncbi:hypothetical protein ADUPG1_012179, partial [Aduncisulcus paluster]
MKKKNKRLKTLREEQEDLESLISDLESTLSSHTTGTSTRVALKRQKNEKAEELATIINSIDRIVDEQKAALVKFQKVEKDIVPDIMRARESSTECFGTAFATIETLKSFEDALVRKIIKVDDMISNIDLVVVFDATGGMWRYIDTVHSIFQQLIDDITSIFLGIEVRVAVIAYRDFDCDKDREEGKDAPPRIQYMDFSSNIEEVKEYIGSIEAYGGADWAEDVASGYETALSKLSWLPTDSELKIVCRSLIHITDAGCHGLQYTHMPSGTDWIDYESEGDPEGRNIEHMVKYYEEERKKSDEESTIIKNTPKEWHTPFRHDIMGRHTSASFTYDDSAFDRSDLDEHCFKVFSSSIHNTVSRAITAIKQVQIARYSKEEVEIDEDLWDFVQNPEKLTDDELDMIVHNLSIGQARISDSTSNPTTSSTPPSKPSKSVKEEKEIKIESRGKKDIPSSSKQQTESLTQETKTSEPSKSNPNQPTSSTPSQCGILAENMAPRKPKNPKKTKKPVEDIDEEEQFEEQNEVSNNSEEEISDGKELEEKDVVLSAEEDKTMEKPDPKEKTLLIEKGKG